MRNETLSFDTLSFRPYIYTYINLCSCNTLVSGVEHSTYKELIGKTETSFVGLDGSFAIFWKIIKKKLRQKTLDFKQ